MSRQTLLELSLSQERQKRGEMVALYPIVFLLVAFCEGSSAMRFSAAFAASVFGAVEELLTVPWYQGVEQVTVRRKQRNGGRETPLC